MKNPALHLLALLLVAIAAESQPLADLRPVEAVMRGIWVGDSLDERRHPLIVNERFEKGTDGSCLDSCALNVQVLYKFSENLKLHSGESWTSLESEAAWDLRDIFMRSKIDSSYWFQANPHLVRKAVPSRKTRVWIPESEVDSAKIWMAEAQEIYRFRKEQEPEEVINYYSIEVKPGDCLSHIARRERVSVREIRAWNDLKGDMIYVGQRLLIGGWPKKSASP